MYVLPPCNKLAAIPVQAIGKLLIWFILKYKINIFIYYMLYIKLM